MARLWWATAGLDGLHAARVCERLAELALVSQATGHVHGIIVHDVLHDFLRAELDQSLLSGLNGMLDTAVADIPTMIQPVVAAQFAWPAADGPRPDPRPRPWRLVRWSTGGRRAWLSPCSGAY